MKIKYDTMIYLGQYDVKPTQLDNEKRCEMAYELLSEAFRLIPTSDENERVTKIYESCRHEIESAMEGIS